MHYHLILTELCNSECRYCYEKSMKEFDNKLSSKFEFDFSAPTKSEVDLDKLKEFLSKDENAYLVFYGGEPLLEIEKIKAVIGKTFDVVEGYRMQTNGKLLDKIPIEYLKKIDKILISLDGNNERTNFNRGQGNYEKVISNIKLIKEQGYQGELIARMTISPEFPDVFEQVKHLVEVCEFTSVHWQIDAGFYETDFNEKEFEEFVKEYNSSIPKLIDYWFENFKKGKVLMFYPFVGIVWHLLNNEKTKLMCGAGHSGYAITPDGKIVACPIMNNIENFKAGNLETAPKDLKKFEVSGICGNCEKEIKDFCGGDVFIQIKQNFGQQME